MRRTVVAIVILSLLTLACSLFTGTRQTATPSGNGSAVIPPTATSASPATQLPTESATSPPVHGTGGCSFDAKFVADVTIPDNTLIQPGTPFRKTWRLRNNGTCDWPAGTKLVFVSGEAMGAQASVLAPAAPANSEADVSVDFVAPTAPGTYKSTWQLETPDGIRFGQLFYVQIVVPQPEATAAPTAQPTATSAPVETPTATPCQSVAPEFAALYTQAESAGLDLGCATQGATQIYAATQEFWANVDHPNPHLHYRSLMLWRSDNKMIYVITVSETGLDSFTVYPDTWNETLPEIPPACSGMTVPTGYVMPIRGFGKAWCDHQLYNSIGWPQIAETGLNVLIQPTERGLLLQAGVASGTVYIAALETATGKAYVLVNP